MIYNNSVPGLYGRNFGFATPYPYSAIRVDDIALYIRMCAYEDMRGVDETLILFRVLAAMVV